MSDNDSNSRREDGELRRLFDAIERVGKDCSDQHVETQKVLDDINNKQAVDGERMQGITSTLDRIGTKLDATSERVAATESKVVSLSNQNATQFSELGELKGEVHHISKSSSKSTGQNENVKWLVGGVLGVCLLVLLAYGSITVQDVKALTP
jgi:ABC-type transporter Mla subunit MlaD